MPETEGEGVIDVILLQTLTGRKCLKQMKDFFSEERMYYIL